MNQEQISKLDRSIENMKNKSMRIYFLAQDTKGNAKGSVRHIYQMAMSLKSLDITQLSYTKNQIIMEFRVGWGSLIWKN